MGKVYGVPEGFVAPNFKDFKKSGGDYDYEGLQKAEEDYLKRLQDYAREHGQGDLKGEVVEFGVADGAAVYVVYSTHPVGLIHVDTGDAYQFQYAHRLTSGDIRKMVIRNSMLREVAGRG